MGYKLKFITNLSEFIPFQKAVEICTQNNFARAWFSSVCTFFIFGKKICRYILIKPSENYDKKPQNHREWIIWYIYFTMSIVYILYGTLCRYLIFGFPFLSLMFSCEACIFFHLIFSSRKNLLIVLVTLYTYIQCV